MVDIHCHALPGLDDGPRTAAEALSLARALVEDGVTHAVLTPHVFPGRYENDSSLISSSARTFELNLAAEKIPLTISWAGEIRMCATVLEWFDDGRLPLVSSKLRKSVLIEMPDGQIPLGAEQFFNRLIDAGITPIIAHPERNRAIMERPHRIRPLAALGCLIQITAGSLVGQFGVKAQGAAIRLVEANLVEAVASDAHNLGGRRPRMSDAHAFLTKRYGAYAADELTTTRPRKLAEI